MQITLLPTFTEAEIDAAHQWITAMLETEDMVQSDHSFPFNNRLLNIYVNGSRRALARYDYWNDDGSSINVGWRTSANHGLPVIDRLAVVGAIISLVGLWEEFHELYIAKAARLLVASYEGVMSGMIQTEAPIRGLAFNPEQGVVAGLIGDDYFLPNGQSIQVDGEGWTTVLDRPRLGQVETATAEPAEF